jgi:hypothetical protein
MKNLTQKLGEKFRKKEDRSRKVFASKKLIFFLNCTWEFLHGPPSVEIAESANLHNDTFKIDHFK